MRLYEVFQQYEDIMKSGIDAITKRSDNAIKSAKVQKKVADITKAKDAIAKKQKQLTDIRNG